eukprot:14277.XXX_865739_865846_1 [CDS] Oithona nana genome sequencing.
MFLECSRIRLTTPNFFISSSKFSKSKLNSNITCIY